MWIARLLPEGTSRYASAATLFKSLDWIMDYRPLEWFTPWIIFAAGVGWRKAVADRYFFWDFSNWGLEVAVALIFGVGFAWFLKNNDTLPIDRQLENPLRGFTLYLGIGIVLFLVGWFGNPLTGLAVGYPYFLSILAIMAIFMIPLGKDEKDSYKILDHKKRISFSAFSFGLSVLVVAIGFMQDEPVISTAAAVYALFPLASLIAPHPRHVRRARLYSVFIFGFFISMRAPWLLIMMFVHFHGMRFYNYFRHGIVSPTLIIEAKEDQR